MIRLLAMSVPGSVLVAVLLLAGCTGGGSDDAGRFANLTRLSPRPSPASQPQVRPPELTENSTLADYLACAAANNPALQASYYRRQTALERIPQSKALDDPQLTYRYFFGGMGFGGGMKERQEFGLSQELPWPTKLLLRVRLAETEARMEGKRYEAARLKLNYDVTEAYAEYWYLGQALGVMEENIRLAQYLESVARARYTAGTGTDPDLLRAQIELSKLDNEAKTLRDLRSPTVAKLNAILNRPAELPFPWPKEAPAQSAQVDEKQLLTLLGQSNPGLKAMELDVDRQDLASRLARQAYLPDFMVGVELMDMTAEPGAMMEADDTWGVMAGINLPIWWGKYAAGVREAQAMRRAAVAERADKANTLAADAKLAAYGLRDAQRRIELYRDTILPKARQAIQAAQASYRAGSMSLLEAVDLQRTLLEFELSHRRALADRWQRLAELEMLVGRELPRTASAVTTQPAAP